MDTLNRESLTETGKLRDELCQELIAMKAEVEKHRKQGKLSLQAIDRLITVTKAVIELTGVRKPVTEVVEYFAPPRIPRFQIVEPGFIEAEQPALTDGNHEEN